ncbi:hypothetical protein [Noviherbaspirillum humi]|uniref:hypothetical protein n=1 Tax=Noviherbaspirillum humi TaxID=1688639 RepID=UPI00116069F0|nr:hypothetical protein [Noviherbaspirillum humi]
MDIHSPKFLIRLAFLVALLIQFRVYANESVKPNICNSFANGKPKAVLLNSAGHAVSKIDLGNVSIHTSTFDGNFFISNSNYRLIVYPKRLEIREGCSNATCFFKKAAKPRCQGTSEFELSAGINPRNFRPGVFASSLMISFFDPRLINPEAVEIKLLFDEKIVGSLSLPWVEIENSDSLENELRFLSKGSINQIEISVINSGTESVSLMSWQTDPITAPDLLIADASCSGRTLGPKETCRFFLRKTSQGKPQGKVYHWLLPTNFIESSLHLTVIQNTSENPRVSSKFK